MRNLGKAPAMAAFNPPPTLFELPSYPPQAVLFALRAAIGQALADQSLEPAPEPHERIGKEWLLRGEIMARIYGGAARQEAAEPRGLSLDSDAG